MSGNPHAPILCRAIRPGSRWLQGWRRTHHTVPHYRPVLAGGHSVGWRKNTPHPALTARSPRTPDNVGQSTRPYSVSGHKARVHVVAGVEENTPHRASLQTGSGRWSRRGVAENTPHPALPRGRHRRPTMSGNPHAPTMCRAITPGSMWLQGCRRTHHTVRRYRPVLTGGHGVGWRKTHHTLRYRAVATDARQCRAIHTPLLCVGL